jgi:hypothetical protein
MADSPTKSTTTGVPTLTEVLAAVAVDVSALDGEFQSIVIRQATPYQYVYRAFPDDGSEYEGGVVNLD